MSRILTASLLLAFPSFALAQSKTIAGVTFTVPKGWAIDKEKPDFIGLKSDDKNAFVAIIDLTGVPPEGLANLRKEPKLVLEGLGTFTDIKVTEKPETEKEEGLTYTSVGGTGVPKGQTKAVDWDVMLVEGGKAPLAVVSFGDLDANEKSLDKLLDSFRKERKKKPAK